MSRTVHLCCMQCREYLWIGQIARAGNVWDTGETVKADTVIVYGTDEDYLAHVHFHTRHLGHPLMTMDSELTALASDGERYHPDDFLEQDMATMPLDKKLDSIARTKVGQDWFDRARHLINLSEKQS